MSVTSNITFRAQSSQGLDQRSRSTALTGPTATGRFPRGGPGGAKGLELSSSLPLLPHASPYSRPLTTTNIVDKDSILWRDFINGIQKRRNMIRRLQEITLDATMTQSVMKVHMLELRQFTLKVIEDAMEIEYRSHFPDRRVGGISGSGSRNANVTFQLPPIATYKSMDDKENIFALVDMITDTDDLLMMTNVSILLPEQFPNTRNPFLLGKTIDELAMMPMPLAQPGQLEQELKVLELLRYRRASKALLKAESQVLNRLPITLQDIERLWHRMVEDSNVEKLIRCVLVFLDNDRPITEAHISEYRFLLDPTITMEPHDFLVKMNGFVGGFVMPVDLQAAVRLKLHGCEFEYLHDPAVIFLLEWINSVLGTAVASSHGGVENISSGGSLNGALGTGLWSANVRPSVSRSIANSSPERGQRLVMLDRERTHSAAQQEADNDLISVITSSVVGGVGGGHLSPDGRRRDVTLAPLSSSGVGMRSPSQQGSSPPPGAINRSRQSAIGYSDKQPPLSGAASGNGPRLAHEVGDKAPFVPSSVKPQTSSQPNKQESNKQRIKREKAELEQRIREEVERALKAQGLMKSEDHEMTNSELLTSMRYELMKIQKELLRRQVLDPKHYKASSVDTLIADNRVAGISYDKMRADVFNQSSSTTKSFVDNVLAKATVEDAQDGPTRHIFLCEREFDLSKKFRGCIDVYYDVVFDSAIFKISSIFYIDEEGTVLDDYKAVDVKDPNNNISIEKDGFAYCKTSKLILNRITGFTLDNIVEAATPQERLMKLQPILLQLIEKVTMEYPQPSGELVLVADRVLFSTRIIDNGCSVDIAIKRSDQCTGLDLVVNPVSPTFPGQFQGGPITIHIEDKELLVLLINQRALFRLALTKWSSMQMVAQWIASRINLNRIFGNGITSLASSARGSVGARGVAGRAHSPFLPPIAMVSRPGSTKQQDVLEFDNVSVLTEGSQLALLGGKEPSSAASQTSKRAGDLLATEVVPFVSTKGMGGPVSVAGSLYPGQVPPGTAADGGRGGKKILMLDVSVNRRIEISKTVILNWRSRNITKVRGMKIEMRAHQDMEMLRFEWTISFKKLSQSMKSLTDNGGLINFTTYGKGLASDDDDDGDEYDDEDSDDDSSAVARKKKKKVTELTMSYALTGAELLVFGVTDGLSEQKIALNKRKKGTAGGGNEDDENANDESATNFMWKVMSRLRVNMKEFKSDDPFAEFSLLDKSSWEIKFDRKLLRDVRTINGCVMMVTVSAVGNELLFEADPTDTTVFQRISYKLLSEDDLRQVVYSEGWPLNLLEYTFRHQLALRLLQKIKVVEEQGEHKLELRSYAETRMLTVVRQGGMHKPSYTIGTVEINEYISLNDLRTLIRYELSSEAVPKVFKFLYKGAICAAPQEPFRKAWECLPSITLVPKEEPKAPGSEFVSPNADKKGQPQQRTKKKIPLISKDKRRVDGKPMVPIPLKTLCYAQDGSNYIYFYDDMRNTVGAGDVIRIGDIKGRDYVISLKTKPIQGQYPTALVIEPAFDNANEYDFDEPTSGNFPFPAPHLSHGLKEKFLRTPAQLGFQYQFLPEEMTQAKPLNSQAIDNLLGLPIKTSAEDTALASSSKHVQDLIARSLEQQERQLQALAEGDTTAAQAAEINTTITDMREELAKLRSAGNTEQAVELEVAIRKFVKATGSDPKYSENLGTLGSQLMTNNGEVYKELWIWKCILATEDTRPRYQKLYDDGSIPFEYEYQSSKEGCVFFGVKAPYRILEVLVTDMRCPHMGPGFAQRITEMQNDILSMDKFLAAIFAKICSWFPQYKKGIEASKFMKLMRESKAFPDIKKPARTGKIDLAFQQEVKGPNGIVEKYVNFKGFVNLLKDMALMRYPVGSVEMKETEDDVSTVGMSSLDASDALSVASTKSGMGAGLAGNRPGVRGKTGGLPGKKGAKGGKDTAPPVEVVPTAPPPDPNYINMVYEKFLVEFILTIQEWSMLAWKEAKVAAMKKEGLRYSAATRIAALMRGIRLKWAYRRYRRTILSLQTHIRKFIILARVKKVIKLLEEDWLVRFRYVNVIVIQSIVRRYLVRCWYYRVLKKIRQQQVIIQKARRMRLKKVKQAKGKQTIYQMIKRINGIIFYQIVKKKDARAYAKDFGIIIQIYNPKDSKKYEFVVDEKDLRIYMQEALGLSVVSIGQLTDKYNIELVLMRRMMIARTTNPLKPDHTLIVKFSKQSLGQRGSKLVTKGVRIGVNKEHFVCTAYETGAELTVAAYHRLSCKVFNVVISTPDLHSWYAEEYHASTLDFAERTNEPELLKPTMKHELFKWAMNRMIIDMRKGKFQVLFACQLQRNRKGYAIAKIQSIFRRALAHKHIASLLNLVLLKINVRPPENKTAMSARKLQQLSDAAAENGPSFYYINRLTGASSWEKSKLMGGYDIPEEPTYQWVPIQYSHEEVEYIHYVNPYTGKYSSLSVDRACRIIQGLVRNFLNKVLMLSRDDLGRVGKILHTVDLKYEERPNKLANVINLALVTHFIRLNISRAKELYAEAVHLSEANPLVTRAFGFFILGTCESPLIPNRERFVKLLADAKRRDPTDEKFVLASVLVKFGVLRQPRNPITLINRALVEHFLYGNTHIADRLFKRVLAFAPFDEQVISLWTYVKDAFPEKQMLYYPPSRISNDNDTAKKGGKKKLINGRPVTENPAWAGWCYVEEDPYKMSQIEGPYWYNPVDGTEQPQMPDFTKAWKIRHQRSRFQDNKMGLDYYYDPLTNQYFQYHMLSDTYQ